MPLDSAYHAPVLVGEVTDLLRHSGRVLDCTLGGGGHSLALLEAGVGNVVGVDRDPDALAAAGRLLQSYALAGRFFAVESNFAALDELPSLEGLRFDGILADLGVSSHQIDDAERGFTFRPGARLDMRMRRSHERDDEGTGPADSAWQHAPVDAAGLLNQESEKSLTAIFRDFGDEPHATRLAREIVRRRATRPFETSDDLVGAIRAVLGPRSGAPDFARLFQAVRIAVNDELPGLERALPLLRDRLSPGGTLVVIAYHSGEDRLVKNAFRNWSAACVCPPKQPVCTCRGEPLGETVMRRALMPSEDEIIRNPRARSARLRAWRKRRDPWQSAA